MFAFVRVVLNQSTKKGRHKKEFVKRANRRRILQGRLGVSTNGIHAIEDLLGGTARIDTKLSKKIVTTKRRVNVEIKKMRDEALLKQSVFGNPRGNTKSLFPYFVEFARDRCMLREMCIAGKQVASRSNNREAQGIKGSIAPINPRASAGIFTSVQRLIEFKKAPKVVDPVI